jgi:hypothetical protein
MQLTTEELVYTRAHTFKLRQLVSVLATKVCFHAVAMSEGKDKDRAPVPAQTSTQPQATTASIAASARNPAATMSDDAPRQLWYLVEGDSAPFKITAPHNIDIVDLKIRIHEQCKYGALQGIDAADLVLFKVSTF